MYASQFPSLMLNYFITITSAEAIDFRVSYSFEYRYDYHAHLFHGFVKLVCLSITLNRF